MKRIAGIVLAIMIVFSGVVKGEIRDVSKRVDGINPDLQYILEDEYTSFQSINPTNILQIDGYRAYTNLSNLINGGEQPLDNASNNELFIGGVKTLGDEFDKMGNAGLMLWYDTNKTDESITYTEFTGAAPGNFDIDETNLPLAGAQSGHFSNSNNYTNVGLTYLDLENEGSAYDKVSNIDMDAILATENLDIADVGLKVSYTSSDDVFGIAKTKVESEFDYVTKSTIASVSDDIAKIEDERTYIGTAGDAAGSQIPFFNESEIVISAAGNKMLGDLDVDGTIDMCIRKGTMDQDVETVLTRGQNSNDPAVFNPGAQTSEYQRKFTYQESIDASALGIGATLGAIYPVSRNTNLKGYLAYKGSPLSGDGDVEKIDQIVKDGGIAHADTQWKETGDLDYERTVNIINARIGLESNLSDNLILAGALGVDNTKMDITYTEKDNVRKVDGTITNYGDKVEINSLTKTTDILLPIGMEWTANNWLKARMGTTYRLSMETEDTQKMTTTEYDADGESYRVSVGESGDKDTTESVNYYSGIGVMVSENLTLDATGIANGQNILDFVDWEIGATLKF